jgi:FMN phosphatase YigB (HAD superfamily)
MSAITLKRAAPKTTGSIAPDASTPVERPVRSWATIRGIIFEVANVFYDATLWRRELVRLLVRLNIAASFPEFFKQWDEHYLPQVDRGFRQHEEAFHDFLLSSGLSWGQIDEVEAATRALRQHLEANVRVLPGVVATISALGAHEIPMVVLTNTPHPAAYVQEQLNRLGLGGLFRRVLTSFDLENAKPSPLCFQAALDALEMSADQVAMIAADRHSLEGAKACGLLSVAFNWQGDMTADLSLNRFGALAELVERNSPGT